MRKIASHYLMSGGKLIKNPIITLTNSGEVLSVEQNVKDIDSIAEVEFHNGLLIPGMVNSHSHLEYSYVLGKIKRGSGLPNFISSIINIKMTDPTSDAVKAQKAADEDAKMSEEGVVAVADHNNNDYVIDIKTKSKIYYHSLIEMFDLDGKTSDEAFDWAMSRVKAHTDKKLAATIVAHASYTMEDRLLALCGGNAMSDKGVKATGVSSIHFKESVEMGGDKESDRIFASLTAERKNMLIHAIYASKNDIDRAVELLGNKLTVVTCPMSNIFIENKITDIDYLIKKGVNIAIGTDSLSSNTVISMVAEMRCLQEHYPNIPLQTIVQWATENGARALDIESWAGSVEVGKRCGIVN
ncbi:MAG: amidohydrolase family protein, partial [Rikenellaceae bacterium]